MIESFSYNGVWFLPDSPEVQLQGKLSFDLKDNPTLEIQGSFERSGFNNSELEEEKIILGYTIDGKKITLYKNYIVSRSLSIPGIPTCSFSPLYVFVGEHYISEIDLSFNKISISFKSLNEWLGISGFKKVEFGREGNKTEIVYEQPQAIDFEINDDLSGYFFFKYYSPSILPNVFNITITQEARVVFEYKTDVSFSEILKHAIYFQEFLTLASFEATYPLDISLWRSDDFEEIGGKKHYNEIKLIYKLGYEYKTRTKIRRGSDFLFNMKDANGRFEIIFQNWCVIQQRLEPVISLLLDSFYNSEFNQNKFINMVQALETFHRRFRINETESKTLHTNKIQEIVNSVKPEYRAWLQEKLNFSYEPTLHSRLTQLLYEADTATLQKTIKNKEVFVRDVKNARNYYTHYDEKAEKKAKKNSELYKMTHRLRLILITLVLLEIGFKIDYIDELLKRNAFRFTLGLLDND